MTDKHEVTVYDRVPATAAVSVEQVEAYLERSGWTMLRLHESSWPTCDVSYWAKGGLLDFPIHRRNCFLREDIERIAGMERRQPSAVLADIAKKHA